MNFLKSFFKLPVLINVLIGIALVMGLIFALREYLKVYTHHDETIEIPDISKMKLFDALPLLVQSGLKYEIDSFKFDDKYEPYTIFEVYPSLGSEVKKGRRIFIRANPKTYAPVAVPNLKDQYKNNAFRRLEQVGLQVGDTIFEPHKYTDVVLRMMYDGRVIKPGMEVPRFSKIDLVIGSSLEKNIPMVDVTGLPLEDARHLLAQNYFEIGRVDTRDMLNPESQNGVVYYQSPSAGEIYDQGETVILFISDQPMEDLNDRIRELDGIYKRTLRTDSTGGMNYEVKKKVSGDISRDVRRQINSDVDESTSRGERKEAPKPTNKPKPQNNQEGIIVE